MDQPTSQSPRAAESFDPDEYRMTIGEHLEELRWRMLLGLAGFAVVLAVCLVFGTRVTTAFCAPLYETLQSRNLSPQLYVTQLGDSFMVFIKISLVSAAAIAAPWILYQLWLFVAAGLYPHERRWVTRYLPLSIGLLVGGMLFVYFLVLPWTIQFFIDFGSAIPLPDTSVKVPATRPADGAALVQIPEFDGDPVTPADRMIWINRLEGRLKVSLHGQVRVIPFGPQNLVAPLITLPDYISLVILMLITFGLSFQLPLVVMALARIGIVEIAALRSGRRYVYFGMAIVAAVITPGDVITATIALMVPLCLLYELGIWLAQWGKTETRPGGFSVK